MIQVTALHANGTTTSAQTSEPVGVHTLDDARHHGEQKLAEWAVRALREAQRDLYGSPIVYGLVYVSFKTGHGFSYHYDVQGGEISARDFD